jgi:hypothetical protein
MRAVTAGMLSLALAGCSAATNEHRQAFDEFLVRANGGPLGVAVAPGSEDRIFECYVAKAASKRVPLSELTQAIRTFLNADSAADILPEQRREAITGLLAVSSTIVGCQGGLPEGMR